jgi:Ca-activated chloride channel homolog
MKKLRKLAVLVVFAAFFGSGCGDDPPPPQTNVPPNQPSVSSSPPPEAKGAESELSKSPNPWPFLEDGNDNLELAENLLAKNYFLVFDGSGSMSESGCSGNRPKIDVARETVVKWAADVPSDANLGLYAFHNDTSSALPLANGPRDEFDTMVGSIGAGGGTPLSDAILYACEALTAQAQKQLGYGEYTVVVVTDGIANDEKRLQKTVDAVLASTPLTIYSIGFCIGERHSLNQPGRTVYKAADNPEQLAKGLEDVLAESESFDAAEFEKP